MTNTFNLSRRGFLAGAAGASLVALTGCNVGGSGSDANALTFLNEETDPATLQFIEGAVERYKRASGVTVSLSQKAIGDLRQLLSSVQAGDAFDLSTASRSDVTYLGADLLAELDGVVDDAAGGVDNFVQSTLIAEGDHYYGFPYNINNVGTYFRSDRLAQIGAEVPRTWDDLKSVLSAFDAAGIPGITQPISAKSATSDVGSELLWSNEVSFVDSDNNVILDDADMMDRTVACLDFLQEIQPYFIPGMESIDYGDIVKSFVTGTSSIVSYSGRIVDTIETDAPDLADKFAFDAFPTPERDMTPSTSFVVNYWLVPKSAASADLAIDFLKWFVENEMVGYLLTGAFNMQPPLRSIYDDPAWNGAPVFQKYPAVRATMDKMARGDGYRASGLWIQAPDDGVLKEQIFSENVIPNMFQRVLIGGESSRSSVTKAADQLRSILA